MLGVVEPEGIANKVDRAESEPQSKSNALPGLAPVLKVSLHGTRVQDLSNQLQRNANPAPYGRSNAAEPVPEQRLPLQTKIDGVPLESRDVRRECL